MREWISVEDAVPESEGMYLCRFDDGAIESFYYWGGEDEEWGMSNCVVTHWMPIPEPPEDV